MGRAAFVVLVAAALALPAGTAAAGPGDGGAPGSTAVPADGKPIVEFVVIGDTKVTHETLPFLSRRRLGMIVSRADIPALEGAVFSSELFESVEIRLVERDGGYAMIAELVDKHSWIVMPTLYVLSSAKSVGFGFAENNLLGNNRKFLVYGQLGTIDSFFVGAYVIPAFRGTRLSLRFDTFLQRARFNEFANPTGDPASTELARRSTYLFLNGGAAAGWNFRWWLNSDVRFRGAYVAYRDAARPDDPSMSLPLPSPDGLDITVQTRTTIDARTRIWGVADGPFAQLRFEYAIPGVSDYQYGSVYLRASYAWKFLTSHNLEVRTVSSVGYHLPFHDEWRLGAASDLRGYQSDQFRGDTRIFSRLEYSAPIARAGKLSFRAVGFYDAGYIGFHFADPATRDYLPGQVDDGVFRSDVGGGLRVYVRNIVLPLLGFDVGYGLESRSPAFYFQIGLTDF